jgi:hypothetical protein
MAKILIKGIGMVEVTKRIGKIPEKMRDPITGKKVKVSKNAYKLLWATKYGTREARMKIGKSIVGLRKVV